jgi:hypothetical protein
MGSQTEDCNEFLYVKYPEVEVAELDNMNPKVYMNWVVCIRGWYVMTYD